VASAGAAGTIADKQTGTLPRLIARLRGRGPGPAGVGGAEPPLDSVTARQWLWGEGFITPGGRAQLRALAAKLELAPGMTVLDVAAGIGGAARMLAAEFRVDTVGLERDLDLARIGMAMSAERRLARRAPVSVYDPESFDLPAARYDRVLACEASYAVRGKERFWRVVMQGLKPEGALVATEFVRPPGCGDPGALERWAPLGEHKPLLWSVERYEDCFKSLGFELRECADFTADHRARVLAGWTSLMQRPELHRIPRAAFGPIIDEAERSMRTVKAFDAGALRMVRFDAVAGRGRGAGAR
jgi:SAM-dependent methyltransferase